MRISLEFTTEELDTLVGLAADQLFRKEFIDVRMPGVGKDHEKLQFSKELVRRLQAVLAERRGQPPELKPVRKTRQPRAARSAVR
ncbi:MAG: hypothetical protein ABI165_00075 [Bryobacteraceae bacterium]